MDAGQVGVLTGNDRDGRSEAVCWHRQQTAGISLCKIS